MPFSSLFEVITTTLSPKYSFTIITFGSFIFLCFSYVKSEIELQLLGFPLTPKTKVGFLFSDLTLFIQSITRSLPLIVLRYSIPSIIMQFPPELTYSSTISIVSKSRRSGYTVPFFPLRVIHTTFFTPYLSFKITSGLTLKIRGSWHLFKAKYAECTFAITLILPFITGIMLLSIISAMFQKIINFLKNKVD